MKRFLLFLAEVLLIMTGCFFISAVLIIIDMFIRIHIEFVCGAYTAMWILYILHTRPFTGRK